MINKHHEPVDNRDEHHNRKFSDKKTDEKIHKHLSDINDEISEQDIKDVRTDIDVKSEAAIERAKAMESSGENKDDNANNKQPALNKNESQPGREGAGAITPWDILNP